MATLDWSQCPAVESNPGKRSGAWVFKGTRMPVATVFENLQDMSVDELVEEFGVTREQVQAVLEFAARSAETPPPERVAQSCSRFWNYSAAFIFSQHLKYAIITLRTAE